MEGQIVSDTDSSKSQPGLAVLVQVVDSPEAFQTVGLTVGEVVGSVLIDQKPEEFHYDGICWHGKAPNPSDPDGPWVPVNTKIYLRREAVAGALDILSSVAGFNNPLWQLIKCEEQETFDDNDGPISFREKKVTYTGELAVRLREALKAIFDLHTPPAV